MNDAVALHAIPTLDPVNDGRHALRDLPLERESIPYILTLPEHGIGAFTYTWVTKDNVAGAIAVVFGPAIGEQPIVEAIDGVVMGPGKNFDDWQVGPLHLSQDLKLRRAKLEVKGARVQLDLQFDALHPAYAYGFHEQGCPPYAATNRLEQAGRVRGTLVVDGKSHAFDSTAARDHSWGTRDWDYAQHWKWLHAQAGDTAVHFWQIHAGGRIDLRGYVSRAGLMAEVVSVDVDFDTDAQYRQSAIRARVRDAAGRTTTLSGRYYGHFPLVPVPSCTLLEGAMSCEIEGQAGVGWTEFMWPTAYLEHLRSTVLR
jgi:hypothetical protein